MVNSADGWDIHHAATVELEVLKIGLWDADPTDLAPLVGLPKLRTLTAIPGKIADPLVISELSGLEYLQIGLDEWQALIDADAVPRSLLAAGISGYNNPPDRVSALFDSLRSRWAFEPYDESRRTIMGRIGR